MIVGQGIMLSNAEEELLVLPKNWRSGGFHAFGFAVLSRKSPQFVGMVGMHGNYAP